jgi:hypothetical protein
MQTTKKTIHIVKHKLTGAMVPVIVKKVNKDNVIEEYSEYLEKRKGFTLKMLEDRWDKYADDILEILNDYQVPAYINHQDVLALNSDQRPADAALFFEEYIYAIEKITKMPHKKLKPILINNQSEH